MVYKNGMILPEKLPQVISRFLYLIDKEPRVLWFFNLSQYFTQFYFDFFKCCFIYFVL